MCVGNGIKQNCADGSPTVEAPACNRGNDGGESSVHGRAEVSGAARIGEWKPSGVSSPHACRRRVQHAISGRVSRACSQARSLRPTLSLIIAILLQPPSPSSVPVPSRLVSSGALLLPADMKIVDGGGGDFPARLPHGTTFEGERRRSTRSPTTVLLITLIPERAPFRERR